MNKILKLALTLTFSSQFISYANVYVEGYLGGMFGHCKISCLHTRDTYGVSGLTAFFDVPERNLSSSPTGGIKVGWWPNPCTTKCDNDGCTAWWEYFGCYLDARFESLKYKHSICATDVCYCNAGATASGRTDICFSSRGPSATLAFLLACRYGFFATDTIPFGRLQPYLAIGPAGLFTRQKTCLVIQPHQVDGNHLTVLLNNVYTIGNDQKKWFHAPCCQLDSGIRYMPRSHVFFDFFFNYRFCPIRINFACPQQLCMKNCCNLFSFGMGIGYEF